MDSILSVPILTPSTRYSKWKLKMITSLKRQDIYESCGYEVYIGYLLELEKSLMDVRMTG